MIQTLFGSVAQEPTLLEKLKSGVEKTRAGLVTRLEDALAGKKEIDGRDGNVCQGHGCSRTVKSVKNTRGEPTPPDQRQRHHIKPKSEGGSGTPENGKTLCPACHKEEHRKMREAKKKDGSES